MSVRTIRPSVSAQRLPGFPSFGSGVGRPEEVGSPAAGLPGEVRSPDGSVGDGRRSLSAGGRALGTYSTQPPSQPVPAGPEVPGPCSIRPRRGSRTPTAVVARGTDLRPPAGDLRPWPRHLPRRTLV